MADYQRENPGVTSGVVYTYRPTRLDQVFDLMVAAGALDMEVTIEVQIHANIKPLLETHRRLLNLPTPD